jgi:transposase-like protein
MSDYLVNWSINVYASSPAEAARKALDIQRDVNSSATVFTVTNVASNTTIEIDLQAEPCCCPHCESADVEDVDAHSTKHAELGLTEYGCNICGRHFWT